MDQYNARSPAIYSSVEPKSQLCVYVVALEYWHVKSGEKRDKKIKKTTNKIKIDTHGSELGHGRGNSAVSPKRRVESGI